VNTTVASFGQSDHPPRGDYSHIAADYTCAQDWHAYTSDQHELYRRLFARQIKLARKHASVTFLHALERLHAAAHIPRFDSVSEQLQRAAGWQIVPVPGLIPEAAFFSLLAARKFPITTWLREPEEFDYIVEPDLFHDFFGHVPLLFEPVFADTMQAYGVGALKALQTNHTHYWARFYWRTIEFGLIRNEHGLRAYGAGLLSSPAELPYSVTASVTSPIPHRIPFELERVLRTQYRIDRFQDCYFVIESLEQLRDALSSDFTPLYQHLTALEELAPDALLPHETDYPPNPV